MADDKQEPVLFPIEVRVGRVKVEVVLLLRPGTTVSVQQTTVTTDPEPPTLKARGEG
jgi:hypothetical protein